MKKKIYIYIALFAIALSLTACYTEVIDNFKEWEVQVIVQFDPLYVGRYFPCDKMEYNNLNFFGEYTSNKSRIVGADIVQFNYWIDSLQITNGVGFNYNTDTCVFDSIKYSLIFAKLKAGYSNTTLLDSMYYEPDYAQGEFEIAKYPLAGENGVNAKDYYRNPSHIVSYTEERAKVISKILKDTPSYYIRTQYGNCVYNGTTINSIALIKAHFDMSIRLTIKL